MRKCVKKKVEKVTNVQFILNSINLTFNASTQTHSCSSDISVSDIWSKGHSEVHSFLTYGPSPGKIPSVSLFHIVSFFSADAHKRARTHAQMQLKHTEAKKQEK